MALQDDYIGEDVPEHVKEIIQTKGVHREILEVRNLKAVTELCIKTTKNLKYQTLTNIFCIMFGAIFSFALTQYYSKTEKAELKKLNDLTNENNKLSDDFQTYRYETNLQLLGLKNQLLELEKAQKQ